MEISIAQPVSDTDALRTQMQTDDANRSNEVAEKQAEPLLVGLAAHIRRYWEKAYDAKLPIEDIMLRALRTRNGEYEESVLKAIKERGGSDAYVGITDVKCRAAISWIKDIMLDSGMPPFGLKHTPIPDLPPGLDAEMEAAFTEEVMSLMQTLGQGLSKSEMAEFKESFRQDFKAKLERAAKNRAERMETKISDQFTQGGLSEAFGDFIIDLVTFPCGFLKGPVPRMQKRLSYPKDGSSTQAVAEEVLAPEFDRVDPFNIYPEPGITNIADGYMFEHHVMSADDLYNLRDVEGYDKETILELLSKGPPPSWLWRNRKYEQDTAERKYLAWYSRDDRYDALEFWGKVSGKDLLEWGMSPANIPDPARLYDANVWLVGGYVIKAVLNYDPLGEKPYVKTSFILAANAFWGKGIPEILEDLQAMANGSWREMGNNQAMSSGPLIEANLDRIAKNQDVSAVFPWQVWQVNASSFGGNDRAIQFHDIPNHVAVLRETFKEASKLMDDHSGIPAYINGDLDVGGAGRTASGLSMLMGSAGKGIRMVIMQIDQDIIKPLVARQFQYNMRFDKDESIKGDVQIISKGAVNLATQGTDNVRLLELLDRVVGNEVLTEITGIEGIEYLLQRIGTGYNISGEELVPTKEQRFVDTKIQEMAQRAQQSGNGHQSAPQALHQDGSNKGGFDASTPRNTQNN